MIDSLLIANRGEIACRIIRTCQRLGIRSIAVYSEADISARHVQMADEAVLIGPADAARSYLDAHAIVNAALDTGAQAVHPGYGFLSEKTVLAELCEQKGLVWVGPRAQVIQMMGSKIEAKQLAAQADVPAVPGYQGEDQSADFLYEQAKLVGFPILIKASAGGGGKGMRRVDEPHDFVAQLEQARQEALRAFGDERVLIEKLIARPRHLEVQLLGDRHGKLIHLFERECSIQRNYQKMIEQAPASNLSVIARDRLFEYALRIGRAIGYDSLGTVEFVQDQDSDMPYFLEMNTRLQVEHTVTEFVTGLDLVEHQIRVASGEELAISQDEVKVTGWAIEARINSEDPARGYQAQIGTVEDYEEPSLAGVRIDSGVQVGSVVTPHYDSMIAKVIGHGLTHELATRRLARGIAELRISGVGTNQALLHDILENPAFESGVVTTLFMGEHYGQGWSIPEDMNRMVVAAGVWNALFPASPLQETENSPWSRADGFRNMGVVDRVGGLSVHAGTNRTPACHINVVRQGHTTQFIFEDGSTLRLSIERATDGRLVVSGLRDQPIVLELGVESGATVVSWRGIRWKMNFSLGLEMMAESVDPQAGAHGIIASPMPGLITEVKVKVGQRVSVGDVLLVMEAMKLIHSLESEIDGIVEKIHCIDGQTVGMDVPLVEIKAVADDRE